MKILVVGDPHMKPDDLAEGERLMDQVEAQARVSQPDYVLITGDLFHNHGVLYVEVLHFWMRRIAQLRDLLRSLGRALGRGRVILMLGNHDGPHDQREGVHSLAALAMDGVVIVDRPTTIDELLFVPFMRSNEEFVETCQDYPEWATLYCHQEFNGCKYDNGFYAPGGVDADLLPQKLIVSGHIHMGQEFGKVWYVGAPRWMTISDANQDRFIWLIEHDDDSGAVVNRTAFPSDPACMRMVHVSDTQESPIDPGTMKPEWKVSVDITGAADWVKERKDLWRGKARIRTFLVGVKRTGIKESEGIGTAFLKYLQGYLPKNRTPVEKLAAMAKERLTFS